MFGPFDLLIGEAQAGSPYPVRVVDSPAGPAAGTLDLKLDDPAFVAELAQVRGVDPDLKLRKAVGGALYRALFREDVAKAWGISKGWVDGREAEGLHLRLWIEPPGLAALPWELLWDPDENYFLATAADLGVSRYLPVRRPAQLPDQGQLRVLAVVESPPGLPVVERQEVQRLENAFRGLAQQVHSRVLTDVTAEEIAAELQQGYHVLHYLGHGRSRQLLLVAGDRTKAAPIDDEAFAQLVLGERNLRLVVLSACHSSQAEDGGLFAGVGPALVQKRMPAVVAMQYPTVQMDTAGKFSSAFYGALARGLPVDVAVNRGRQALSAVFLADRDWSTPVLYLGTRSFRVLDPGNQEAREVKQAWQSVHQTATDPVARAALSGLALRFEELSARVRALEELVGLARRLRDLSFEFEPCRQRVEQAQGVPAAIDPLALGREWQRVRQGPWPALAGFVEAADRVKPLVWYQGLQAVKDKIETALAQDARLALATSITQMDDTLAEAEEEVRRRTEQAVADLVRFSGQVTAQMSGPDGLAPQAP